MSFLFFPKWVRIFLIPLCLAGLPIGCLAADQVQPVVVTVTDDGKGASLVPQFLGLSYESSMLLPQNGLYYFDAHNTALVNTFKTLGIKSLRVGANAVDDPRIPVPQEKDIDSLFAFARAAGDPRALSFQRRPQKI